MPCISYFTGANILPRRSGNIEIFILKKSKSLSYIRGYIKLNYIPTIATKSLAASKKLTKFILPSITNGNSLIFSRKLVVVIVSEVLAIWKIIASVFYPRRQYYDGFTANLSRHTFVNLFFHRTIRIYIIMITVSRRFPGEPSSWKIVNNNTDRQY